MTSPTFQDNNVLLILGEVRGDVKGIAHSLIRLEANINAVEDTSDARFAKLEARLSVLEQIKIKVGALAVGVGLTSGFTAAKLPALINAIFGG